VAVLEGDLDKAVRALDSAANVERMSEGTQRLEGASAWRGHILGLRAGLQRAKGDGAGARERASGNRTVRVDAAGGSSLASRCAGALALTRLRS
jgi:hypothetical protein